MIFAFLCLDVSLSMIFSGSILVVVNDIISFFSWLSNIPFVCVCVCFCVCVCTTSSLSIHMLMDIRLVLCFDYCKYFCYEHWSTCIFFSNCSFVWIYAQEWDCSSFGSSTFSFLRNLHTILHSIPTSRVGGFLFFHSLSSMYYL